VRPAVSWSLAQSFLADFTLPLNTPTNRDLLAVPKDHFYSGHTRNPPKMLYKGGMRRFAVFIFFCILIASTNVACGQTAPLCGSAGSVDRNEITFLPEAPHGAKRIGKHTLEVNWAQGVRRFVDKDCTEGYIGGSCWEYRGYCASLHLHHINHENEDLFTGVLLDDTSGKLLPGGGSVFFSPDGKKYLASSQWDGKEFSDWKLYSREGTLLWAGDSGIVGKNNEVLAEFENPSWSSSGDLLVDSVDSASGKKVVLIMMQGTDKKWKWVKRK
jgi:hypothetical protein